MMSEVTELLRGAGGEVRHAIDQIIAIVNPDLHRIGACSPAGNHIMTLRAAMASCIGDASDPCGAFLASSPGATRAKLERLSVASREHTVPILGLNQLFVDDPNGVVIELDYPSAEA